MICDVSRKEF